MPRSDPRALPATSWAVLGLLSFGRELTGYELKKWADASLRLFWESPAMSHIYAELKRLEKLGYVAARDDERDGARPKRVYRITDEGLAALTDWVRHAPVEPPVVKHSVALRLWLGHLAPPERLREIVAEHADNYERLAAEAQRSAATADVVPEWLYPALVSRWSQRRYAAELALVEQVQEDLQAATRRRRRTRVRTPKSS